MDCVPEAAHKESRARIKTWHLINTRLAVKDDKNKQKIPCKNQKKRAIEAVMQGYKSINQVACEVRASPNTVQKQLEKITIRFFIQLLA